MKLKIKNTLTMFDFVKGLGMVLVLLTHSIPWDMQRNLFGAWCMSFLMPMYFITSGYFMKKKKPAAGFRESVRFLLVPYLITILCIAAVGLLHRALTGQLQEWVPIFVIPSLLVRSGEGTRIGAMWFVFALFLSWCLFYLLMEIKNEKLQAAAFVLAGILGGAILPLELPFQIGQALIGTFYVYCGFLMKKKKLFTKQLSLPLLAGMLVIWAVSVLFGSMDLAFYDVKYGFVSILGSLAGSYLVLRCVLYLNDLDVAWMHPFRLIGRYTMWILAVHAFEAAVIPWAVLFRFTGEYTLLRVVAQLLLRSVFIAAGCVLIRRLQVWRRDKKA